MSLKVEQSASQLLHEAFVSLRTLGKRSILALLGIVIGSSSVVALINIGHNAAEDAAAIFQNMGTDTLVARFPASADSRTPLPAALDTRAPRAMRMPISRRRSETFISITFITPTPPPTREMPPRAISR